MCMWYDADGLEHLMLGKLIVREDGTDNSDVWREKIEGAKTIRHFDLEHNGVSTTHPVIL